VEGGSYAAKRLEAATWEISFAQSKNPEQSSLASRTKKQESAPGVMQISIGRGFCGPQQETKEILAKERSSLD